MVATLADNGTPITSGSVQLYINGVEVTATITHANGITTVVFDALTVTNNTATLVYSTAGGTFSETWSFTTSVSSTTPQWDNALAEPVDSSRLGQ